MRMQHCSSTIPVPLALRFWLQTPPARVRIPSHHPITGITQALLSAVPYRHCYLLNGPTWLSPKRIPGTRFLLRMNQILSEAA